MSSKQSLLGFDRFINQSWADAALEMRISGSDLGQSKAKLREWLAREISGKETIRKTTTQISRVWLAKDDPWEFLRKLALFNGLADKPENRIYLHYGMALNIFPLFRDVCRSIGRLANLQTVISRQLIIKRTMEKYSGLHSSQAAVYRVVQTLIDWNLIQDTEGRIAPFPRSVENQNITAWLICALVSLQPSQSMLVADLNNASELLGLRLIDSRNSIQKALYLRLETYHDGEYVHLINSSDK